MSESLWTSCWNQPAAHVIVGRASIHKCLTVLLCKSDKPKGRVIQEGDDHRSSENSHHSMTWIWKCFIFLLNLGLIALKGWKTHPGKRIGHKINNIKINNFMFLAFGNIYQNNPEI